MTPESLVVVDSAGHWAQLRCDLLEGSQHAQATPLNINKHQTQTTQKERLKLIKLDIPLEMQRMFGATTSPEMGLEIPSFLPANS